MRGMTISQAAREAGVGVETIRFYERRRLIERPPTPSHGGFRIYPMGTVKRVRFIRQAQELGFSLGEIEELLSLRAEPSADCADVRERAEAKLDEVKAKLAQLARIRDALEQLIAACPGRGAIQGCSILEAFDEAEDAAGHRKKRNHR
jgi:MerR family copper efflux transcriptional regulator